MKFKVGDRIRNKTTNKIFTVTHTNNISFYVDVIYPAIRIEEQDNWELVSNKFDITILKPFAEVLVRNTNNGRWHGQLYMSYNENEEYPFECAYNCWKQCIPYEGNEHLHNKTDDCTDYFKTW